jgi:hypothetical protein
MVARHIGPFSGASYVKCKLHLPAGCRSAHSCGGAGRINFAQVTLTTGEVRGLAMQDLFPWLANCWPEVV